LTNSDGKDIDFAHPEVFFVTVFSFINYASNQCIIFGQLRGFFFFFNELCVWWDLLCHFSSVSLLKKSNNQLVACKSCFLSNYAAPKFSFPYKTSIHILLLSFFFFYFSLLIIIIVVGFDNWIKKIYIYIYIYIYIHYWNIRWI
jgi:hypothetical protein